MDSDRFEVGGDYFKVDGGHFEVNGDHLKVGGDDFEVDGNKCSVITLDRDYSKQWIPLPLLNLRTRVLIVLKIFFQHTALVSTRSCTTFF